MTQIVVSNVIRYITHFRLYNQITFRLLLIELVYHIDLNSIILYHTLLKIKVLNEAIEEPFCLNGSIKNL